MSTGGWGPVQKHFDLTSRQRSRVPWGRPVFINSVLSVNKSKGKQRLSKRNRSNLESKLAPPGNRVIHLVSQSSQTTVIHIVLPSHCEAFMLTVAGGQGITQDFHCPSLENYMSLLRTPPCLQLVTGPHLTKVQWSVISYICIKENRCWWFLSMRLCCCF